MTFEISSNPPISTFVLTFLTSQQSVTSHQQPEQQATNAIHRPFIILTSATLTLPLELVIKSRGLDQIRTPPDIESLPVRIQEAQKFVLPRRPPSTTTEYTFL